MGRPPKVEGERRRPVSVSLGQTEIDAIRELSRLKGESQGKVVGDLVLRELAAEHIRRKRRGDDSM